MSLTLPECDDPELSVVMVTHGAWPLTERAVAALVEHTQRPLELIVIDNDSDDQTRAQLAALTGARVTLNEANRGFGVAVNQGAEQARGEHLLLLNTDAFVHPGWLEPLLETLAQPAVGAAVPRYLHEDGTLQEAGVLLARDGTVLVYGDGDDPQVPCYRFRRTVDYGSAVCMLMRTDAFAALGGFDHRYAPAYYEDADFCIRLAEQGLNVVYDPRSTVTHVRYGSGGRDQAFALSERNRTLFAERWCSELVARPPTFVNATEQAVIASRDALARPRVLICARPDEPGAEPLIGALLACWPRARLTWATNLRSVEGFDPDPWLNLGVEMLDHGDPAWLNSRLFHYDVVVCGASVERSFLDAIDHSQPQAPRLALGELDSPPDALRERLTRSLARAGIAPAA